MGGPRANCFLRDADELLFVTEHYSGTDIPHYVLIGEIEYVAWVRKHGKPYFPVAPWGVPRPADSAYAEGAILADFKCKVLIIGFDCWLPEFEDDSIPERCQQFHEYVEFRSIFTEFAAPLWPNWTIHYADYRDFGIHGNVQFDLQTIKPLDCKPLERDVLPKQTTRNFRNLLEAREARSAKSRRY